MTRPWGDVRAIAVAEAAAARDDSQPAEESAHSADEGDAPTDPAAPLLALTIAALKFQVRRTTHASRVRVSADEAQAHLASVGSPERVPPTYECPAGLERPSTAADQSVPWLRVHSATGRGVDVSVDVRPCASKCHTARSGLGIARRVRTVQVELGDLALRWEPMLVGRLLHLAAGIARSRALAVGLSQPRRRRSRARVSRSVATASRRQRGRRRL